MGVPFDINISFSDEDPEKVLEIMKEVGADNVRQVSERGFTGIEIVIVGILIASALTNLIIRLTPLWKCGIVVDARDSPISTTRDCDLPRGTVLVIGKDGTQSKLHEPSEVQLKELLEMAA